MSLPSGGLARPPRTLRRLFLCPLTSFWLAVSFSVWNVTSRSVGCVVLPPCRPQSWHRVDLRHICAKEVCRHRTLGVSLGWNSVALSHQCSPTQDLLGIKLVSPAASQARSEGWGASRCPFHPLVLTLYRALVVCPFFIRAVGWAPES